MCALGRASAFCSPTRGVGMVTLLASMGTQASAEEWEPIKGLKTTKTTVKASTPGAPIVVKGDTVTVHATGTVSTIVLIQFGSYSSSDFVSNDAIQLYRARYYDA